MVPGVKLVTAKQDGLNHVAALCDLTLDTQLLLQEGRRGGIHGVTTDLSVKMCDSPAKAILLTCLKFGLN